jgi:RNA-directed DNA polymerase
VNDSTLMEEVVERDNLVKAYKRVCKNQGAPGIDGMDVKSLKPHLNQYWPLIKQELITGTYQPKPVRRIEIPKPDGGIRLLGVPTVLDRFIQQAILQILTPIFEPLFSAHSYGFRPNRSAHQALDRAQHYINCGKTFVVDIDLEKFFDRVNHDILISKIWKQVKDVRIICILRRYLQAGVMINGVCMETDEGTPQGGPISPLLANIMLTDLDKELEERGHKFVRYADDCNIYVASKRAGLRVYQSIKTFIETKLKLRVNENKSAVDIPHRRTFLGFSFYRVRITHSIKLRVAGKSVERFKDKIRKITDKNNAQPMTERIKQLRQYITGWSCYFSKAESKALFVTLDAWIRRRLRMCLLKQWKLCKTKWRELMYRGIDEIGARAIACSRKKYWRLSQTPQLNKAMGVKYWEKEGLVSLVDAYYKKRMTL